MRFQILLLMAGKNEQNLKQYCHPCPIKKCNSLKFHLKVMLIELRNGKNLPAPLTITYKPSMISKSMVYTFCYTF